MLKEQSLQDSNWKPNILRFLRFVKNHCQNCTVCTELYLLNPNALSVIFCTLNLQKKGILAYIFDTQDLLSVLLASCCKMDDSWSYRWKDLSCIMGQPCEKSMLTHQVPFQTAGYRLFTAYNQHISVLHFFIFFFFKAYWLKLNNTNKPFYLPNMMYF